MYAEEKKPQQWQILKQNKQIEQPSIKKLWLFGDTTLYDSCNYCLTYIVGLCVVCHSLHMSSKLNSVRQTEK